MRSYYCLKTLQVFDQRRECALLTLIHLEVGDAVMPMEDKGRILVVDDEVGTGYALKSLLELEWFQVIIAADGDEAYQLACAEKPDLLITDINMPKLNGLDLIKRIKKEPRLSDLPMIVISAAEKQDLDKALESGAGAALAKPIEIGDLIALIEKMTLARRRKDEAQWPAAIEPKGEDIEQHVISEMIRYPLT